ncbi:hypothetical protein, partial [Klebsiella pneumoniae]|uniref:hypothetical protein n=1 Tax=Klebsiella pneumoniae TaxID=573 RepID=UPI0031B6032B
MPGIVLVNQLLTLSSHLPGTKELNQEVYHEKDDFSGSNFILCAEESANKQVISSQADSLIKISRIWADF